MALEFIKPTYSPVKTVNGQTGDVIIEIPSHEGLATEAYVDAAIANIPEVDLENYATVAELERAIANVEVDLTGYATEDYVNRKVEEVAAGDIDLTDYATKTYVDEAVAAIDIPEASGVSEDRVNEMIDERGYVNGDDVSRMIGESGHMDEEGVSRMIGVELDIKLREWNLPNEERVIELIEQYGGSGSGEELPAAEEAEF